MTVQIYYKRNSSYVWLSSDSVLNVRSTHEIIKITRHRDCFHTHTLIWKIYKLITMTQPISIKRDYGVKKDWLKKAKRFFIWFSDELVGVSVYSHLLRKFLKLK